jgi:allophanate hydrolase subunit 1
MSLAQISLPTNKTDSIISDHVRKIGQGERGQTLSVIVLDANNSGYDLTDKTITFSENKEGGKIVSDSSSERIKITDAKAGRFNYTLCEAVYAISGVAWFDISSKDGTIIDTTKSFNIEVVQDESIHINNDNYVSSLEALETHYQAIIKKTEENTESLTEQFKKDISQAISDGNNRVEAAVNSFNALKVHWDAELTKQKQAIADLQNNWKVQADTLKDDFNRDKNATIEAANKNFNDKLASIQTDYNTWKVSAIKDFQNQLNKLQTELKSDEDAQKQLQTAIDDAKAAINKIQDVDFTKFAHLDDLKKYYTKDEIKSLDPLNSPDGNNIYDTQINLDTFSTVGITKFLNCQLKSTGAMFGFDQATDKLYGWIFNIPKWNGATEFQQIVYIYDYGQGTLRYVRSRVNNEGTNKEDFEKVLTDKDLQQAIDSFGQTKTVNGVKPDSTGNIAIKIPSDYVKSVNGQTPDSNGNVNVDTGGVKTINGKKGDVTMATFAPNLLKGTSEQARDIPPNASTDVIHLTTDSNTKYTVAVDIDYTAFASGSAGCKLQVNNGGAVVVSPIITDGSKGRVSVTFTTPDDCSWVAFLLNSNSSYTGQYSCLKASRWQDNETPPDMTWLPNTDDNSSAIKNLQNQITANASSCLRTWVGTLTQYQAMATHEPMTAYVIISDYKVVIK